MGRIKAFIRDEVLDQSIRLFWKKGISETSLQDLEGVTGVNKSGLYSEFKDKDDIFTQSLKRYTEQTGELRVLRKQPLGQKNIEAFFLKRTSQLERGCFLVNSMREVSILPPEAKKVLKSHFAVVKQALVENIMAENPDQNPEIIASILLSFSAGVALSQNMVETRNLKAQVDTLLRGILKRIDP